MASAASPDNNVCQELDALVLQHMALIDEHLAAWNRISDRFQQGRELISQAKYIMGPRNVSADCYDLRMKALRGIAINGPSDISLRDLLAEQKRAAINSEESGLKDEQVMVEDGSAPSGLTDEERSGRSGLRRRGRMTSSMETGAPSVLSIDDDTDTLVDEDKFKKKGSSSTIKTSHVVDESETTKATATTTSVDTASTAPATLATLALAPTVTTDIATAPGLTATGALPAKKKRERNPDPLLWFGVFVPAPLRNAQTVFQKGLQDVVEMAIARQKLFELEEAIRALQRAKDKDALVNK
ncbi:hypothetical protein BGZ98_009081 [Dissophora globulifera]|nr:hypothetical protein BGZ98_009081 [Dissophora globulifera]